MATPVLTTQQFNQLNTALNKAFDVNGLDLMMALQVGKDLGQIVSPVLPQPNIVLEVTRAARRQGWVPQLVEGAWRANPGNDLIASLAKSVGLSPATDAQEREITALGFIDLVAFREWLAQVEAQVCRIELPNAADVVTGTGFLVAPDVVMTNYHVVEDAINAVRKPERVTVRFDYKTLNGRTTSEGTAFSLAQNDWLIDASPPGPNGFVPAPGAVPEPSELDYALLRLAVPAGETAVNSSVPVDPADEDAPPPRGWVTVPKDNPVSVAMNAPLFIVQHPKGKPIKLAFDTQSIISVNANKTRVRYKTNTDHGSSGSPCFDQEFNLVALHHSGDPAFAHPEWNQGIPIPAIVDLLKSCGKADLI